MIRRLFLSFIPLVALVFSILGSAGAQAQLAMTFWGACSASGGSFSHVQAAAGVGLGPGLTTSWSSTLGAPVTSGNMVAGFVTFDTTNGTTIVSVTDDKSNSYLTPAGGFVNDPGHNQAIQAFYVANVRNAPSTVTVTFSNGTAWLRVYLDEFSGAAPSPLDKSNALFGTSTNATDGAASPTVTTGSANELVYGIYQSTNGATPSQTTGTGFTVGINGSSDANMTGITEYLVQSAPGPVTATFTPNSIISFEAGVLTFLPKQANCQSQAGGGGGGGGGGGSTGPLVANKQFWGTGGHNSTGSGQYGGTTVAQEAADMKTVYQNTPNTIPYRGDEPYGNYAADTTNFQTAGIIPYFVINANPNFGSFANQTAAYNAGYADASSAITTSPSVRLFEIGNEWTIYSPYANYSGDGSTAANWRAGTYYSVMLGYTAGAVAAIRDKQPTAQVIGGAYAGWIPIGLPIAMGTDLQNYNSTGRDLRWDFTVVHWYQDSCGGNGMGTNLANYDSGRNVYTQLKPIGKPIFVTEFGSAACSSSDTTAAGYVTAIMDNLLLHKAVTATEPGVAGGSFYQLYNADYNSWLFNAPGGSLTATATAVQSWITTHGNGN